MAFLFFGVYFIILFVFVACCGFCGFVARVCVCVSGADVVRVYDAVYAFVYDAVYVCAYGIVCVSVHFSK